MVQGRSDEAESAMSVQQISLTEDDILTALRAFLVSVLPDGIEVIQGQVNRVPMPLSDDFVVMTPANRAQMATNVTGYDPDGGAKEVDRSTSFTYQLDVYGPCAADNAQIASTLLRDDHGCTFLKPYGLAPLYCDDGQQMPLVTGEQQFLNRWMMRGVLQANVAVTVPMQFADTLITTLLEY
jgi:hypothetical protein